MYAYHLTPVTYHLLKMNRLKKLFASGKKDILNIYFTAGFPERDATLPILEALHAAKVDIVEIGIPYSDPLADGPTIQNSGMKALENGMDLNLLFEQIKSARAKGVDTPFVMMGYYNQIVQMGEKKFFANCVASQVDGLIIPDLPLAVYQRDYQKMFAAADIAISFLITPQTPDERIKLINKLTTGFIYVVSNYAITGAASNITETQVAYFERIEKMNLSNPRLIGFGISNKETFETACKHARGAIIGSAFIKNLEVERNKGKAYSEIVGEFVEKVVSDIR